MAAVASHLADTSALARLRHLAVAAAVGPLIEAGLIKGLDLFRLEDNRHYFPPYDAVPVARAATLLRYPSVRRALEGLAGQISADDMQAMNDAVDAQHQDPPDVVRRFLAAFRKGSKTWDSAFLDAHGNRQDQPNAPEMIGIVADALHAPPAVVARGIGYFDPENRIILSEMQNVLDWYEANGMIKTHIDAAAMIDKRFVIFAK